MNAVNMSPISNALSDRMPIRQIWQRSLCFPIFFQALLRRKRDFGSELVKCRHPACSKEIESKSVGVGRIRATVTGDTLGVAQNIGKNSVHLVEFFWLVECICRWWMIVSIPDAFSAISRPNKFLLE
jgi:hypothetical protein